MPFPNRFQEDSSLFREALSIGIIDTSTCRQSVPAKMMRSSGKSTVPRANIQNIDENSEALRTQIHTFDRTDVFLSTNNHLIELARIVVPEGNVGHINSVEQYMADSDGRFYASASEYWGMPYNETVNINDIIWFFRVDSYDGSWLPQFYATALVMPNPRGLLPGAPWFDLPEFNGLWYPANLRKEFSGTIPSGKQLRFFAYVPPEALTVYSWRLSGRLTARVQSELCKEAQYNTRVLQ